jgi:two-component system copper resistance phosphate regulon response regulator CusR
MDTVAYTDYSPRHIAPPRAFLPRMRILIAGDSRGTVEALRSHFFQKTCEVETAYTSEEIRMKLQGHPFDLFICGFLTSDDYALRIIEIVRRVSDVRVLFLTGKKDSEFNAKALNLGADDCLTSPASFFELDARVLRLCCRGANLAFRGTKIFLGTLEIDMNHQVVKKNERRIDLTRTEYRILLYLARNSGALVTKGDLEKILLSEGSSSSGHSINTHILNLRKKIRPALSIKTISGHGFVLLV